MANHRATDDRLLRNMHISADHITKQICTAGFGQRWDLLPEGFACRPRPLQQSTVLSDRRRRRLLESQQSVQSLSQWVAGRKLVYLVSVSVVQTDPVDVFEVADVLVQCLHNTTPLTPAKCKLSVCYATVPPTLTAGNATRCTIELGPPHINAIHKFITNLFHYS